MSEAEAAMVSVVTVLAVGVYLAAAVEVTYAVACMMTINRQVVLDFELVVLA